ncbi:MAG: caspase family protein, partial [Nannocystaceae bacterium]|nr:caspase family protein [Nannocystaceae bacterium]
MRWAMLAALIVALMPSVAEAAIVRYAVIIGNNEGASDEPRLRFAETDAARVHEVLATLGDFREENMVLLQGLGRDAVQRVLIATNDRIRRTRAPDQAVLFVFYSGHADADALHLGSDRLELSRLQQLVRGSAADLRLLVLDSCRSGAITRVKGGKKVQPFAISVDTRLAGEGVVFLTSSSANEDAQESDELKGSFFTHYLVSGLVGPADTDRDGAVTLAEAYGYAYDNTIRASSKTLIGTHHPTFEYNMRGQGDVVLTRVRSVKGGRARLSFPEGRAYLVFAGDAEGAVVAEVGATDATRNINVAAGRYFVRGRGRDHLLEGSVRVRGGDTRLVEDGQLQRVEYAR